MKKPIIAFILILALAASAGQALAFEDTSTPMSPVKDAGIQRFTLISTITPTLSTSGTTASYALTVVGISSVKSISVELQLQKLTNGVWKDYGSSWKANSSNSYLMTSGTKTVDSGYTYQLKATITASDGTTIEHVTSYS